MDIFEGDFYKWEIIFKGSEEFIKFKEYANPFNFNVIENIPHDFKKGTTQRKFFEVNRRLPIFIHFKEIKAKDRFAARHAADQFINFFADTCSFHEHSNKMKWSPHCIARKSDEDFFLVKSSTSPMRQGIATRMISAEDLQENIESIFKRSNTGTSIKFIKAMDYHRNAIETRVLENQLVSLWSALESFLPISKEESGKARIVQYIEYLLPSLTLNYSEKIFSYISNSLYHAGDNVKKMIEKIQTGEDFFTKVIALLVCSDMEKKRQELYSLLEKHPLLKYRCKFCFENFKSNEGLKELLKIHKKKVEWHIQRIYATRNRIVHSAECLPYIGTLIENLHTYFDFLMNSIIQLGEMTNSKLSVSSALKTLQIHEKIYLQELDGEKIYCSKDNFKEIIFGKINPLSPFTKKGNGHI